LGETTRQALRLSRDEASHLQAGLDFYHFLLPKMLVATSALRLACDRELVARGVIERDAPEVKAGGQDGLHDLFKNIRGILSVSHLQGPVQMPRVWSKYLAAASAQLKPIVQGENYHRAANQLHKAACGLAPAFQARIASVELDNLEAIAQQARKLETLLPPLIISITLLELYFRPADRLISTQPELAQPISQSEFRQGVPARCQESTGDVATAISCPG
jgi:hypothetical protein